MREQQTRIHPDSPLGWLAGLIFGKLKIVDVVKILRQVPASRWIVQAETGQIVLMGYQAVPSVWTKIDDFVFISDEGHFPLA